MAQTTLMDDDDRRPTHAPVPAGATGAPAAEWVHISKLVPWSDNPTVIGDSEIAEAIESFRRFGFGDPIVARIGDMTIAAGHVRRKAIIRLLHDDPSFVFKGAPGVGFVPVRLMNFENDGEFRAYALRANNRIGVYDEEQLAMRVRELDAEGVDVKGLGFSDDDLEQMRKAADDASTEAENASGPAEGPGREVGSPVIHYDIVFDDESQQNRWYELLRQLKQRYPTHETVAARLDAFLSQVVPTIQGG